MDLRQIKASPDDFGLMTYDPAFMNTANCRSAITFIDGDKGVLLYRGYPIEQLAEDSNYLETAYLILFGELPTEAQLQSWTREITLHTMLHENIKKFMEGFRYDDDADDWELARGSVLGAGRGGGGVVRAAARRRQRGRAANAERDRNAQQGSRIHQEGQSRRRQGPPDGIRPPRVQVLRPARESH